MKAILNDGKELTLIDFTEEVREDREYITLTLPRMEPMELLSTFQDLSVLEKITVDDKVYHGFLQWGDNTREDGDKFILELYREIKEADEKDKQITDMQLAICELFELLGGGE